MKQHPADIIERLLYDDFSPSGQITVDIRDERGKLVDHEVKDNFISIAWKAAARAWLRMLWMQWSMNPTFTGGYTGTPPSIQGTAAQVTWPNGKGTIPMMPNIAIGCWNETAAESSTTEHMIRNLGVAGMVAWATKYPVGGTSLSRGTSDSTLSILTDFLARHVYNWSSTLGNGTFQSVGLFNPAALGTNYGIPWLPAGYAHRGRATTAALTPSTYITGATGLYGNGGWFDTSTKKYYTALRRQATSGAMRIVSFDFTNVLLGSNAGTLGVAPDVTGLTPTTESIEDTPTSALTTAGSSVNVIGRDSTPNTIFTYAVSAGSRWGKIASSGASTTFAWPGASSSGFTGSGCVIGTQAYLANQDSSSIYSCTISTGATLATLAIDANVTTLCTALSITTPRVLEVCTDGTDLYVVYTNGASGTATSRLLFVRLNTSGVLQEVIALLPHYISATVGADALAAPYAAISVLPSPSQNWETIGTASGSIAPGLPAGNMTGYSGQLHAIPVSAPIADTLAYPGGNSDYTGAHYLFKLIYADGAFYDVGFASTVACQNVTAFTWYVMRYGYNLGSRVLLGASKTKTVGQTMAITYDITLPGWF